MEKGEKLQQSSAFYSSRNEFSLKCLNFNQVFVFYKFNS